MEHQDNVLKTGTTTVALVCKDGVVLAADRRATAGYVANKHTVKILQIAPNMAITTAGTVSDIQLLAKLIQAEIRLKDLHVNRSSNTKEVANMLAGMLYHNLRRFMPGIAAFLLGGYDDTGAHAYQLSPDGAMMEVQDYASDGSGCVFALGVLETVYKKNMTVEEGVKVAMQAVNAALQRDIYSGNGINVVTLTNKGVETVLEKEINIGL
ncbi:proteasome subunit beta [Candidatus Woesearchaeota archaeon]|nr:proteasome subunit beta [Candidatus Woesearchaeota archaeon]